MFEHLDDPTPFQADARFKAATMAKGRRKRLGRRALAGTTVASVTLAAVGLAGALYTHGRDEAIDRVDITNAPSRDEATNILVVGVDTLNPDEGESSEPARSDTIAVIRLRQDGQLGMLLFPRDLLIPGTGNRLNSAYATGGPQGLIDTVTGMTGIPIDHYVEVDFEGFIGMVDEVGGLHLRIDQPLFDANSGLDVAASECATLDGETALALVRARHIDEFSDLGRITRQQAVMTVAVEALGDVDSPGEIDRLSRLLADHARVDGNLTLGDIIHLGRRVAGSSGVAISHLPIAASVDRVTVELAPGAEDVFAQFGAADAPTVTTAPGSPAGQTFEPLPPAPIGPCA